MSHMHRPGRAFHTEVLPSLAEFDLGGVLYHANYFHLYEAAREALLREAGLPYPQLVQSGCHFALTASSQEFKNPIFYGEKLQLYLWTTALKRTQVTCRYLIETGDENERKVVHLAETKLVFVQKHLQQFKPSRVPEPLFAAFRSLLIEEEQ